jgi:hypothetical protein
MSIAIPSAGPPTEHALIGLLQGDERVVPLPLEGRAQARESLLDALGGGVADGVQPLGQDALGLAREALDREIELA